MEPFEATEEDYDHETAGLDRKRHFSKEDAIYGIFNDSPDNPSARRQKSTRPVIGKMSSQTSNNPKFGEFEKYTKGIGSKLLGKMGYRPGEGLGVRGEGISKPIEVSLRPKGIGIGFAASENQPDVKNEKPNIRLEQQEDIMHRAWKKSEKQRLRTAKMSDLPQATLHAIHDSSSHSAQTPVTIIDMSGPETRIVTDLSKLGKPNYGYDAMDRLVRFPELWHNLELLVSQGKSSLHQNENERLSLDKILRSSDVELAMISKKIDHEKLALENISRVVDIAEKSSSKAIHGKAKMDELLPLIAEIQETDLMATRLEIDELVYSIISPALRPFMSGWEPLEEPELCLEEVKSWRVVLDKHTILDNSPKKMTPYEQLIYARWLPKARSALATRLDLRQPSEAPIKLFELWKPVLPAFVYEILIRQILWPKVETAIEHWNPRVDKVPCHSWLHQWLSIISPFIPALYNLLKFKFAIALSDWHPSEDSALNLLTPWREVFDSPDYEALLMKFVIPKITAALLGELSINPAAQDLSPIEWALAWSDHCPAHLLALPFLHALFPKLRRALYDWMTLAESDYEEVFQWYKAWRALFPEEIMMIEEVKKEWKRMLEMMNRLVEEPSLSYLDLQQYL